MKTKNLLLYLFVIIGLMIFSCTKKTETQPQVQASVVNLKSGTPAPSPTITHLISDTTAHNNLITYLNQKNAPVIFQGFTINKDQLKALNALAENPMNNFFKIYMGVPLCSVVGIDRYGENDQTVFGACAKGSGPCPYMCDESSSIFYNPTK